MKRVYRWRTFDSALCAVPFVVVEDGVQTEYRQTGQIRTPHFLWYIEGKHDWTIVNMCELKRYFRHRGITLEDMR